MNLYLNGVEDFSIVREDTLAHPAFVDGSRLRKFDVVLANPPYSIKTWNREAFMNDKWGRNFLGTPPQKCADYAFIQHILASMNQSNGRCAILLPHGVLNRLGEEKVIREKLVALDLIDSVISIGKQLFFNSPMEACIIVCQARKPQEKMGKIRFIYATDLVIRKDTESYLTTEHINAIVSCYHSDIDIEGRLKIVDKTEIERNDFTLSTKRYVKVPISDNEYKDINECLIDWKSTSDSFRREYSLLSTKFDIS
jgi:type I restriction enzyme M protein